MVIGQLRSIWRYPVKSMAGEGLATSPVEVTGLVGDRGWALRDDSAGEIRGAKKWPILLRCSARYRQQPAPGENFPVNITLPDGACVGSDDADVGPRLSALLGQTVSLWPLQPAGDKTHYRRARAGATAIGWLARSRSVRRFLQKLVPYTKMDAALREEFSREPGEPLPDLSDVPPELFEFTCPPGTYFDAFPIHLLTTASLRAMARVRPDSLWDVHRFRPNFLIETREEMEGLVENAWSGGTLRLGSLVLKCALPTVRCGMTTHAQAELPKDPLVLRTIVRAANQNLGIYATVISRGRVALGDSVEIL
jgi:uncharacterized protein YcbX